MWARAVDWNGPRATRRQLLVQPTGLTQKDEGVGDSRALVSSSSSGSRSGTNRGGGGGSEEEERQMQFQLLQQQFSSGGASNKVSSSGSGSGSGQGQGQGHVGYGQGTGIGPGTGSGQGQGLPSTRRDRVRFFFSGIGSKIVGAAYWSVGKEYAPSDYQQKWVNSNTGSSARSERSGPKSSQDVLSQVSGLGKLVLAYSVDKVPFLKTLTLKQSGSGGTGMGVRREGRAFGVEGPELRVMGEGKRIRNRFSSGMNARFYDKVLQRERADQQQDKNRVRMGYRSKRGFGLGSVPEMPSLNLNLNPMNLNLNPMNLNLNPMKLNLNPMNLNLNPLKLNLNPMNLNLSLSLGLGLDGIKGGSTNGVVQAVSGVITAPARTVVGSIGAFFGAGVSSFNSFSGNKKPLVPLVGGLVPLNPDLDLDLDLDSSVTSGSGNVNVNVKAAGNDNIIAGGNGKGTSDAHGVLPGQSGEVDTISDTNRSVNKNQGVGEKADDLRQALQGQANYLGSSVTGAVGKSSLV